jgi:hypothetical protein
LVKYVSLDDEDLNEPQRAFMKLIAEFNGMLKLREDAQLLKELEAERNKWEVIATVATDYLEKAVDRLNGYYKIIKMYEEMLSQTPLCLSCRNGLLNWIVMYSLTRNLQTVSQQITSQKK